MLTISRHDGGVNTKYYLNSKLICTSSAIYGGGEATTSLSTGEKWDTITGYTLCTEPVKITTGDKLVMSVVYDLTKYRLYVVTSPGAEHRIANL